MVKQDAKLDTKYSDEFLMNPDNWMDQGIFCYLCKLDFWVEIGEESARILGAEPNSPAEDLLMNVASSSWNSALDFVARQLSLDTELFNDVMDNHNSDRGKPVGGWGELLREIKETEQRRSAARMAR